MTTLVWLQREFRLQQLPALSEAIKTGEPVILAYFHDDQQTIGAANQVWLASALKIFQTSVQQKGGQLWIIDGNFSNRLTEVVQKFQVQRVFYSFQVGNPFSDMQQQALLVCKKHKVKLKPFFSEFLFKPTDISTQKGTPYLVFTPFYKQFLTKQHEVPFTDTFEHQAIDLSLTSQIAPPESWTKLPADLNKLKQRPWAQKLLSQWQIGEPPAWQIFDDFLHRALVDYPEDRDIPGLDSTSHLSPYLHFGHLSLKQLYFELQSWIVSQPEQTQATNIWLRQLVWKEFARHLLYWYPQTQSQPFQAKYDQMVWSTENSEQILAWQKGLTGIPIIDAGMRELWHTGFMHNRVRMLVASFLTKNLNQHWLIGQKWFDDTLLDADPANNSMGWQWVAGCGVDAAPYYRLFNPVIQSQKFDPEGAYIRRWIPELTALSGKAIHAPWEHPLLCETEGIQLGKDYPFPLVDLAESRQAHLDRVEAMKHKTSY